MAYPFIWLISKLPFSVLYLISDALCFVVYRIFGYRKKIVRKNLNWVFPEKTPSELIQIERQFYRYMCDMFLEMIKAKGMSQKQFQQRMIFENVELLHDLESHYGSFILLCGHYASYEWLLSLQYQLTAQAYGIYTPITNPYFDRLIHNIRARYGAKLMSRYRSAIMIARHQLNKEKCAYGFVADQSPFDFSNNYRYPFLGINVPVFVGAERIAKRFNLPVVYCHIQPLKRGYYKAKLELISDTPNQVPDYQITDMYFQHLEKQIREAPQYYLWTHNRFKYRSDNQDD